MHLSVGAFRTIIHSSTISRIGLIQGLTEGALQTFVILWPPALQTFANSASDGTWGLGKDGEPAYGLIFGSFMAFGVFGGFMAPVTRKAMDYCISVLYNQIRRKTEINGEFNSVSAHLLCAISYLVCSILLLTPSIVNKDKQYAFSLSFAAFLMYELMIGLYMPCEGIVRSIHMPNESICSLMTMLRVVVNVAVALGVISTKYIPFTFAFGILSIMMVTASLLQLSLIPFRNGLSRCNRSLIESKKVL